MLFVHQLTETSPSLPGKHDAQRRMLAARATQKAEWATLGHVPQCQVFSTTLLAFHLLGNFGDPLPHPAVHFFSPLVSGSQ